VGLRCLVVLNGRLRASSVRDEAFLSRSEEAVGEKIEKITGPL
jgi:hypothetical protein